MIYLNEIYFLLLIKKNMILKVFFYSNNTFYNFIYLNKY